MNIVYGQTIRNLLREKGMTQTALAKKVGLPQGVISRYIRDIVNIPADRLVAIADALHVPITVITGPPPSVLVVQHDLKNIDPNQLLSALKEAGYPPEFIEFMRRLHGVKLQEWQVKIIDAAISEGEHKKEE